EARASPRGGLRLRWFSRRGRPVLGGRAPDDELIRSRAGPPPRATDLGDLVDQVLRVPVSRRQALDAADLRLDRVPLPRRARPRIDPPDDRLEPAIGPVRPAIRR